MLFKNKKEITQIFKNNIAILVIYKGSQIIWEGINSCFGKGFWLNKKPWVNKHSWRNK